MDIVFQSLEQRLSDAQLRETQALDTGMQEREAAAALRRQFGETAEKASALYTALESVQAAASHGREASSSLLELTRRLVE